MSRCDGIKDNDDKREYMTGEKTIETKKVDKKKNCNNNSGLKGGQENQIFLSVVFLRFVVQGNDENLSVCTENKRWRRLYFHLAGIFFFKVKDVIYGMERALKWGFILNKHYSVSLCETSANVA